MKNKTLKLFGNTTLFCKVLFFGIFVCTFSNVRAQFSTSYGDVNGAHDNPSWEMVTCPSVNENYAYAGVQSNFVPPAGNVHIRGVMIDASGALYTSNFNYISTTTDNCNIFPLKIIPLSDNSGYVITGYVTAYVGANTPKPFVIVTDDYLVATDFKIFDTVVGFFTDVDELPSSSGFLFCGSESDDIQFYETNRSGLMIKTNTSFVPQWSRHVDNYTPGLSKPDFDNIQEAIAVDQYTAYVCGTVTTGCSSLAGSRTLLAEVDLSNGTFNWQKSEFVADFISARIVINDQQTEIALAINGYTFTSCLAFYDMAGNFQHGRYLEFDPLTTSTYTLDGNYPNDPNPSSTLLSHVPYIQNIYYNNNDADVYVSGKFIDLSVTNQGNLGLLMPFSVLYDAGNNIFTDGTIYKSNNTAGVAGFLHYIWNINACGSWQPLWAPSNTIPRTGYTDEYVTITGDRSEQSSSYYNHKVWSFTNDFSACGAEEIIPNDAEVNFVWDHFDVTNSGVSTYGVTDLSEDLFTGSSYTFNCSQP